MALSDADLLLVVSKIRQRLTAWGDADLLCPPCAATTEVQAEFRKRLRADIPTGYLDLLQHFDGCVIQDIEFFGSQRRRIQLASDDAGESVTVRSIVEENLEREQFGRLERFVFVGRWESGAFVYVQNRGTYAVLDSLSEVAEELPSIAELLRFTVGRVMSL